MPAGSYRRYLHLGAISVALVLAAAAAWFAWEAHTAGFNAHLFWVSMGRANWLWLSVTAAFMILSYYGRVLRWAVMIEPSQPHPSHWNLFKATAIGFSAIVLLGRPGELVRPYLIAQSEGLPFTSQLAAWLLERVYDILMVVALFGFALAYAAGENPPDSAVARWALQMGGWIAFGGALACLLLLFALHRWSGDLEDRIAGALSGFGIELSHSARRKLAALAEGLSCTRDFSHTLRLLALSALEWAIIVVGYHAFFKAFPETSHFALYQTLVYVGFIAFGSIVQIPGIGGGLQVVSAVVLVEFFGLPLESASGISILIWAVSMLIIVPVGAAFALSGGLKITRLKTIASEIEP